MRVTRKEWYSRVNAAWPAELPPLTPDEAIAAARKLYRFAKGRSYTGTVYATTGRRYSGFTSKGLAVNAGGPGFAHYGGWESMAHSLSHHFAAHLPHGGAHARLEIRMIKEVIKRGWLSGSLKKSERPAKPKPDAKALKYARTVAGITRWEAKQRRAQNALKKLRRSLAAQNRHQ